ncbi:chain length determinant protein EpsF [Parasulfuritortus cantonensis]|uniref:Chain length determinant protein EpsF n=1 Tax=Parasulfuritortus cantonensis TaxID=2528202 RepID=A0A4R1BKL2_9PROT|nr:chain length determinant protein EpsF [Parasulfuritortus cantonensis]TCJ17930.1 chain length determinant protein EpsF [Parasulfuritortus cantonensis]
MNFATFIAILRARLWLMLGVLGVTVATAVAVSLILPPTYKATSTIVVDAKSKDPVTGAMIPVQLLSGYVATQVDIITSHNVAVKVVNHLKLADIPQVKADFQTATEGKGNIRDWLADKLVENLSVDPSRESSAVGISFKGADPKFAAVVANAFASAYIDTNLELRTEPARQVSAWYENQLKQLRGNLEQAQTALSNYQREHGLVASDERLDVETSRLGELSSQLVAAQSSSIDAASRQSGDGADVMNSGVVQQLRTDLARREAELAQLAQNLGQNHPQYLRSKAEVDTLRAKLEAEKTAATRVVTTTASAARQREANLRGAVAGQKARVLALKQQRDEVSVLVRDVQNAQQIYDAALQRYSQSQLEAQTTQTDIAVLNPAIAPIKPDSPKLLLNVVLAVFLGGMLAVGVAFLMEMLDRRVRAPEDIVDLLGVPVLGVLSAKPGGWFKSRAAALT